MIRVFKVSIPSSLVALIVSEAILAFSSYVLATYWVEDTSPDIFLLDDGGWWRIALVVTVILLGLYFHDLYDNYRVRSRILLVQQLCLVLGIAFLLQAVFSYGRWDILLPKWMMVYGSVLVLVMLPAWRIMFASLVWKALGAQRVLFLGASSAVREMIGRLGSRPELGLAPIGYLESDGESGVPAELSGTPRLGCIADLDRVIASQHPDRIVVGMTERRGRLPVQHLLELRFSGIHIEEAALAYETLFGRVSTRDLRPSQLIFSTELGPQPGSVTLQSVYSLLFGAIGIVVTIPVMAVVAILVKLTSPGPVLHRQQRVGLNGAPFTV